VPVKLGAQEKVLNGPGPQNSTTRFQYDADKHSPTTTFLASRRLANNLICQFSHDEQIKPPPRKSELANTCDEVRSRQNRHLRRPICATVWSPSTGNRAAGSLADDAVSRVGWRVSRWKILRRVV